MPNKLRQLFQAIVAKVDFHDSFQTVPVATDLYEKIVKGFESTVAMGRFRLRPGRREGT